jgi:hypothetical protein
MRIEWWKGERVTAVTLRAQDVVCQARASGDLCPPIETNLTGFSEESPMPATLAFIVIPAKAGIQARPTRLAQQDDENCGTRRNMSPPAPSAARGYSLRKTGFSVYFAENNFSNLWGFSEEKCEAVPVARKEIGKYSAAPQTRASDDRVIDGKLCCTNLFVKRTNCG